jgi:hypothetical protein
MKTSDAASSTSSAKQKKFVPRLPTAQKHGDGRRGRCVAEGEINALNPWPVPRG